MLTVKTHLGPSKIHGIGLFASEDIEVDTVVWQFHPFFDKVLSGNEFFRMCREFDVCALHHFLCSSYKRGDQYYYLTDNARFINHSPGSSNIGFMNDFSEVSLRKIYCGEELLEDYTLSYDIDDFFFTELLNPDPRHYILREGDQLYA